jgi:hypothetical protein
MIKTAADILRNTSIIETGINHNRSVSMEYPNIIGTSIGKKCTKGILTDTIAYKFFVNEKIPLSELKPDEIIPEFVTISNQTYPTDVIEIHDLLALGCYDWFDGQGTPTTEQSQHRVSVRPLTGGTSVVNYDDMSYTAGTLGLIARDLRDNSVIGVTNAHVFCKYAGDNQIKETNGIVYNTCNKKTCQPSPIDVTFQSSHDIGVVKRFYPLKDNVSIDAAITHIKNSITVSTSQLNLTTSNLPWATDIEIDGLISQNILLSKSGRTTGSIGSILSCPIKAIDVNLNIYVQGYDTGLFTYLFTNCIGITYSNYAAGVSVGGDSGSAVIGTFGGVDKVIGLLFAGGSSPEWSNFKNNFGVVCRITNIANLLDIGPLNPSSITYSNESNWKYKATTDPAAQTLYSTSIDGKKYWQIGNTYT